MTPARTRTRGRASSPIYRGVTDWSYILNVVQNFEAKERLGVLWNQVIEKSPLSYVCLLNSDCLVTDRWLSEMMLTFRMDDRIAAVGPSTGECKSEQKIGNGIEPEQSEEFAQRLP